MRMGLSRLEIAVLRCAELFAPDLGSQLWDYLAAPVCLMPLGYDPMLNLLSLGDAARALALAARATGLVGAFNIAGKDTLPLSRCIACVGKRPLRIPGPLLGPLYRLRHLVERSDFSYALNAERFHHGLLLDGSRARLDLGYEPTQEVRWP
jgi:UDP-glucose 4-epimerase